MRIEHVALYVEQLERMREFYSTYFGAVSNDGYHNPRTGLRTYFLSFSDGSRLELMNRPQMQREPKGQMRTGYIHLAFSLGSREAVDLRLGREARIPRVLRARADRAAAAGRLSRAGRPACHRGRLL